MSRELVIKPSLCIGCSTCSLTCSITWGEDFDVSRAYVRIGKDDKRGLFTIAFSSECRGCKKCGETCPSGALRIVNLEEPGEAHQGESKQTGKKQVENKPGKGA